MLELPAQNLNKVGLLYFLQLFEHCYLQLSALHDD